MKELKQNTCTCLIEISLTIDMMMTFFSPQARMFELDTIRGKYGINVIMFKVYGTYVDINGNKSTF